MTIQMWTSALAHSRGEWDAASEGLNGPRKNLTQAVPGLLLTKPKCYWKFRKLSPAKESL